MSDVNDDTNKLETHNKLLTAAGVFCTIELTIFAHTVDALTTTTADAGGKNREQ